MLYYKNLIGKTFSTFALAILMSISALAQGETWKEIRPASEGFSVEIPGEVTELDYSGDDNTTRLGYKSQSGDYFFIFCDSLEKPDQTYTILGFAGYAQPAAALSVKDNTQGKTFKFTDADGMNHAAFTISTKTRACVFQTSNRTAKSPETARFFKSIKFDGKMLTPTELTSSKPATLSSGTKNASSGVGTGNGVGSGSGSGSGSPAPVNAPPSGNSPLRIISKPRANYTDFARFYRIMGQVTLRITFLANSEIGEVSPISGLGFGLTKQCIEAAKGIKFEPARENGNPVTVTKMVQYGFTLY